MRVIRTRVPASCANLGPGFDVLGMAVDLYNQFTFHFYPERSFFTVRVRPSGEGIETISRDESNLVYRAFATVSSYLGEKIPGMEIEIGSRIPLSRGLGSSATAIVAGVMSANMFYGNPLSETELLALASRIEGHPDNVTPAVTGGITVIIGETSAGFKYQRIEPPSNLMTVILVPDCTLDTSRARAVLPDKVPFSDAVFNCGRTASLVAALVMNRLDLIPFCCIDRLHEPYREHLVPGFAAVRKAGVEAGALAVCLSGAGPSIIALVDAGKCDAKVVGEQMERAFRKDTGLQVRTLFLRPVRTGAQITAQQV